jgi:23S rRNA (uridine2552-2'-O)-methyltransferase
VVFVVFVSFIREFYVKRDKPKNISRPGWIRAHVSDPYVRKAQAQGYRSRAAYKLQEIARQDRLLGPGMLVVDLGAAPGSWSQVALEAVGRNGRVVAIDLLEVEPLPGMTFIRGDLRESDVLDQLAAGLNGRPADLVLCDMAPNLSGIAATDQARSRDLCEIALDFATRVLKPGGAFLVKTFQGTGYREFLESMRRDFTTVASRKPGASRDRSAEMYLLGKGFRVGS